MEAIREIVDIQNNQLSMRIPASFNYDRVEVVILPLPASKRKINKVKKSSRGSLRQYANKSFIEKESSAWSDSMEKKHEDS